MQSPHNEKKIWHDPELYLISSNTILAPDKVANTFPEHLITKTGMWPTNPSGKFYRLSFSNGQASYNAFFTKKHYMS